MRINLNDGTPETKLSTEERQHEIIRDLVAERDKLRIQLAAARVVVEAATVLRRATMMHHQDYSCMPTFDDALAEWRKVSG